MIATLSSGPPLMPKQAASEADCGGIECRARAGLADGFRQRALQLRAALPPCRRDCRDRPRPSPARGRFSSPINAVVDDWPPSTPRKNLPLTGSVQPFVAEHSHRNDAPLVGMRAEILRTKIVAIDHHVVDTPQLQLFRGHPLPLRTLGGRSLACGAGASVCHRPPSSIPSSFSLILY